MRIGKNCQRMIASLAGFILLASMFAVPASGAEAGRHASVKGIIKYTGEFIETPATVWDIFDPWYPMGNGSLRDVVFLGLHVCQMMGYEEIMNSWKLISVNAAKTLHVSDHYGIEKGKPANFIVLDAKNYYDALTNHFL